MSLKNNQINTTIPSTRRGLKEGFDRVTFIVRDELVYKLNCIASIEDVFLKDTIDAALSEFVARWEAKNGKLRKLKVK